MESLKTYSVCFVIVLFLTVTVFSKNLPDKSTELNVFMKNAKPLRPDSYICTAYPVEYDEAYIYKFQGMAEASTAHHMLMYGCDGPELPHTGDIWPCPGMCKGGAQTIMFAWAKNAPPVILPKGVGLKIGKESRIKTIVLQIHYAKAFSEDSQPDTSGLKLFLTNERPRYTAGILLMMSAFFQVPPQTPKYAVDMSCQYTKSNTIYPFAYRTHAHDLGKVITGYVYDGSYHMIGKGNPQWPQTFYPVKQKVEVNENDFLAARCTFDSSNRKRPTNVGATGKDEMCNFYIMYYTDSTVDDLPYECYNNMVPSITGNHFPADVSVPLPHNATLEEHASGHHHHNSNPQPNVNPPPMDITTTTTTQKASTPVESKTGYTNSGQLRNVDTKMDRMIHTDGAEKEYRASNPQGYENVQGGGGKTSDDEKEFNGAHFPNYDYDNINPRDLSHKHRMNQEYYDDYSANDWREQSRYQGADDSNVELSRNRNKEFDAMNKQLLQQQFSEKSKSLPKTRPSGQQQQQQQQHQMQHQRGSGVDQNQQLSSRIGHGGQRNPQAGGMAGHHEGSKLVDIPPSNIHIEKKLVYQPSWPKEVLDIGQVGGVSADKDGNVYIFHRASRIWDFKSFDYFDNFKYQDAPIDSDVVVVLDKDGKFIRKFGKGQYFMPHGITVDHEGNIWLTDVAMHQVFKIKKDGSTPVLTLGQRFKHSQDLSYFCKPSDVAILSTGEFFVADGYCNNRIVKFSKEGNVLKSWGKPNVRLTPNPEPLVFQVVHNIAVSEKDNLVCAADRENGRIQCFDLDGNYKFIIKHKEFGSKLFALDFSPRHGGVLYAVNGPGSDGRSNIPVQGFTMDAKNGALIDTWNLPQSLKQPHDMCIDPTSDSVYVGELDPRMVWKLTRMSDEEAKAVFVSLNHHDDDDDDDDHVDGQHNVKADAHIKLTHKELSSKSTPASAEKISSTGNSTNSSTTEQLKMTAAESGLSASMIMGLILTVPVIILLIVVLVIRSYRAGHLKFPDSGGKGSKRILNMQNIFGNSHKGFDPLSTEESDHDLDPDDSDQEEYAAPRKTKT